MYNILYKYKHASIFILKGLFVLVALFFIVYKIIYNTEISITVVAKKLAEVSIHLRSWVFLILVFFSVLNWWFEILKWKILVQTLKKITFKDALTQTLASHTIGFTTPNKIGEYGAKALFYEKINRKKILGLNFIGNSSQLIATLFFGSIGMFYLLFNFTIPKLQLNYSKFSYLYLIILIIIGFLVKKYFYKILSNWFTKLWMFLNTISTKTYLKVLALSVVRYAVFSHQFYFFLLILGIKTHYFSSLLLLFCMYFIATVLPNLNLFDWAIKGSVAVFLFGLVGILPLPIIVITTVMWLLNFALPAIIGSGFVLFYKPVLN